MSDRVNELSELYAKEKNAIARSVLTHSETVILRSRRLTRHACARARAEIIPEMHRDLRKTPGNCARNISRELKFPLKNLLSAHSTFKFAQNKLALVTPLTLRLKKLSFFIYILH